MVKVNNLNFSYKENVPVLKDITLALEPGNIYGLFGKNGEGKTTLLKILASHLFRKDGDLSIFDFDPTDRHPTYLSQIFFLPEEFEAPPILIHRLLQLYASFYPKFDKEKFYLGLESINVSPKKRLDKVSFGQKKKVMLLFALATNVKLLLLDEPTNGIDITSKSKFRKLISDFLHEDNLVVISTHQAKDIENLIDNLVLLDNQRIILNQSLVEIAEKIIMKRVSGVDESDDILYHQQVLGGHIVLQENIEKEQAFVDLEILFCSLIQENSKTLNVLGHEQ